MPFSIQLTSPFEYRFARQTSITTEPAMAPAPVMHPDTDSMERACVQAEAEAAASIGSLRGKFVRLVDQLRASERRCHALEAEKRSGADLRDAVVQILDSVTENKGKVKTAVALVDVHDKLLEAVQKYDAIEAKKQAA